MLCLATLGLVLSELRDGIQPKLTQSKEFKKAIRNVNSKGRQGRGLVKGTTLSGLYRYIK